MARYLQAQQKPLRPATILMTTARSENCSQWFGYIGHIGYNTKGAISVSANLGEKSVSANIGETPVSANLGVTSVAANLGATPGTPQSFSRVRVERA